MAPRPTVLDYETEPIPLRPDSLSWELTRAVQHLRLTIADASLRAREDARQFDNRTGEHWTFLGHAHGYQKTTEVLRRWAHPDMADVVIAQLEDIVRHAKSRQQTVPSLSPVSEAYYTAYRWALDWVLTQVREICAGQKTASLL